MLRNQLRRAASGRLIFGTTKIGIDAAQIVSETATGDQGPGLIYAKAVAYPGRQLRAKITGYNGTPGKLFVFENGSFLITGESDGAYTINFDWEAWALDGSSVITGSDSSPVQIGPLNASAGGGTGTGSGSGIGGAASGGSSATASGGTGVGTGSGSGGDASAQQNGNAGGGTGTGSGSGSGGDASAGAPGSAIANGGTGTGTGSGSGGDATAQANAQALGGLGAGLGTGFGGTPNVGGENSWASALCLNHFAAALPLIYMSHGVEAFFTQRNGGGQTRVVVLHDQPGMTVLGGTVLAVDHRIRYLAGTLPDVRKNDTFLIGNQTFKARENAQPELDGLEYIVPLAIG